MKTSVPQHVKTKRLCRLLRVPVYQAVGLLEMLWHLASECADDGGIGKYTDEDIACHVEWERDPTELVSALVAAGWLDRDDARRLMVHDWLDHCPEFIRERLRKRKMREAGRDKRTYDDKTRDKSGTLADTRGQAPDATPAVPPLPNPTEPNPTEPNPTEPNPTESKVAASPPSVPDHLRSLMAMWNSLPDHIVLAGNGVRMDPPSKEILEVYPRIDRDPDVRAALADVGRLRDAIMGATFVHRQSWFTLPWLFGKNKNRERNATKLLKGGYVDIATSDRPKTRAQMLSTPAEELVRRSHSHETTTNGASP